MTARELVLYIRRAAAGDAPDIDLLRRALAEELALLRPEDCPAVRGGVKPIDLTPRDVPGIPVAGEIYLAVEHHEVVGFISLSQRELPGLSPHRRRRCAVIDGFFVYPGCRGRGIGAALLQEAKRWTGARGLDYLEMTVFSDSRDAVGLCRSESFQEVRQTLRYVY